MPNSMVIKTGDGHVVSLIQVGADTINCTVDGGLHVLTGCQGLDTDDCVTGNTTFMGMGLQVTISLTAAAVTVVIAGNWLANSTTSYPIGADAYTEGVAFVKACKLPAIV